MPSPSPLDPAHDTAHRDYLRVREAIAFVRTNRLNQPALSELAQHLNLSEHHVQRLFTRWAGVSPKQFLQYLTKEHAKALLREHTVLDTSLSLGLSGTGRLHDLMVQCEGVTPGEYQRMGQGLDLQWGLHDCPFGLALLGVTPRGLCHLALLDDAHELDAELATLATEWPAARLSRGQATTCQWAERIFGGLTQGTALNQPLPVLLKGSPFQLKVWEALLRIPTGELRAYQAVAEDLGAPQSTRAVASAIAQNKIALLIPCHRVIRSTGDIHAYRWGSERKQALLAWEAAQRAQV